MTTGTEKFLKLIGSPVQFRLFLLSRLPSAYFSGVRIREASEERCVVTVPYNWFTRNPFRSTYFACLSMAAEMSTGALAMAHLYGIKPAVSLLVTKVESTYSKKASGITWFTCEDGLMIKDAIRETISSGQPTIARALSIGRNKEGEVVAEFHVTWSFKQRGS
jgi:hypothetical protein